MTIPDAEANILTPRTEVLQREVAILASMNDWEKSEATGNREPGARGETTELPTYLNTKNHSQARNQRTKIIWTGGGKSSRFIEHRMPALICESEKCTSPNSNNYRTQMIWHKAKVKVCYWDKCPNRTRSKIDKQCSIICFIAVAKSGGFDRSSCLSFNPIPFYLVKTTKMALGRITRLFLLS